MKRILFSVVFMALIFTSESVFAGPAYNWTGPYVGLQGMYATGISDWDVPSGAHYTDHILKGGMGGLFLGFNYQFPINLVAGVETEINYGKLSGSSQNDIVPTYTMTSELNWLGSTRVRLGYAVWRFLPYVAVGVAYTRSELYIDNHLGSAFDTKDYRFGWTPSIGLEFAITQNLLARAEYAYYDFGSKTVTPAGGADIDNRLRFQGFKLGLAWKFGGAKEVAKAEPVPPPPPPPPVEEMKKAPEAAPVVEQTIIEKGRVTMNVEFDTGKAVVKPDYYKEIEGVTDVLKKYPDLKIIVEGHTDNIGGEKYNNKLSQKRADAIKEVMVNKYQIDPARITAKGFGFSNPLGDNKTKEGRKQNRRVEAAVDYEYKVKVKK
jgi:outer membrane protein OmpA-like peptidoglycan-associated protein/opacity protein-like surface antigen